MLRESSKMLGGTNPHTPRGCTVNSKPRNFPIFLYLLSSIILTSCGGGGGGDFNVNFPPVSPIPPVTNTDFEAVEVFSAEVPVVNHTQFNLTGKDGVVTVTGISGATSVMITAIKRVQSESTEDANAHLQELEVNVQDLANEVRVETIQPIDEGGRNYIVDYTISLPIFLEVHVQNIGGIVTLDTINNDVTVIHVGGNITLRRILGSALIDLVAGTIEGEITLPLNGAIDMKTVSGDINLAIPVNTSAEFSAAVNIGSISDTNLVLLNEVRTSTFLSGTLGSGQGTITLETEVLGNISVSGF